MFQYKVSLKIGKQTVGEQAENGSSFPCAEEATGDGVRSFCRSSSESSSESEILLNKPFEFVDELGWSSFSDWNHCSSSLSISHCSFLSLWIENKWLVVKLRKPDEFRIIGELKNGQTVLSWKIDFWTEKVTLNLTFDFSRRDNCRTEISDLRTFSRIWFHENLSKSFPQNYRSDKLYLPERTRKFSFFILRPNFSWTGSVKKRNVFCRFQKVQILSEPISPHRWEKFHT